MKQILSLFLIYSYFLIEMNGHHKMHPGQSILIQEFRKQLLGLPMSSLTYTQLTEKTW